MNDWLLIYLAGILTTMLALKIGSRIGAVDPEWYFWESAAFSTGSWLFVVFPLLDIANYEFGLYKKLAHLSWKDL